MTYIQTVNYDGTERVMYYDGMLMSLLRIKGYCQSGIFIKKIVLAFMQIITQFLQLLSFFF